MEVSSAVIGSGVHVTMVAMVDNASGVCKAFMKSFINVIIAVQTNATLHTIDINIRQHIDISLYVYVAHP